MATDIQHWVVTQLDAAPALGEGDMQLYIAYMIEVDMVPSLNNYGIYVAVEAMIYRL